MPTSAPFPTPGRDPSTPATQAGVLDSLPGSASAACVQVGNQRNVRAGAVALGDFVEARQQFAKRGHAASVNVDLQLFPEHAKTMTSATVRITPPGSAAASTVRTTNIGQAEPYRYFALTLPIKASGTYQLRVTAGSDRGCFRVSFGS